MLATVGEYITEARTMLQDKASVKRYSDEELKGALGIAIDETRKYRPEMFLDPTLDAFNMTTSTNTSVSVPIPAPYRLAFVHYMVGHVLLREQEDIDSKRAGEHKNAYLAKMLTLGA